MGKTYTKEDKKRFKDSYVFKRNRRNKYNVTDPKNQSCESVR